MHDVIIIGAGPAGLTAALHVESKDMKCLLISKELLGKMEWYGTIDNFPGFPPVQAKDLGVRLLQQVKLKNVDLIEDLLVTAIDRDEDFIYVHAGQKTFKTHSVIIATGQVPEGIDTSDEIRYKNRSVTYCSESDAPLFAGRDIAVVGGDDAAMQAAIQLMAIAKRVYLLNPAKILKGDPGLITRLDESENLFLMNNTRINVKFSDDSLTGISIKKGDEELRLDVHAVLLEFVSTIAEDKKDDITIGVNHQNEIVINERCETNIPGIFAAGDVTNVADKQIVIATGQGATAALSAARYLKKKWKETMTK